MRVEDIESGSTDRVCAHTDVPFGEIGEVREIPCAKLLSGRFVRFMNIVKPGYLDLGEAEVHGY